MNVCALARQPTRFAATPDVSAFSITDHSEPHQMSLSQSLTKVVNVRALARQPIRFAATPDVSAFSITDQSEPHQMSTTVCKLSDEQEILNEIKPIIQSMRRIMHQSGHKEEQQPKKVEANQIRIEKELQKEDALRRKGDTYGIKVASSGTDPENQNGSVDGFMSKRVTSMSTSRVAVPSVSVDNLLNWISNTCLATSEGGAVLSMESQSREAIDATNILTKVVNDPNMGRSKGYVFVKFADEMERKHAMKETTLNLLDLSEATHSRQSGSVETQGESSFMNFRRKSGFTEYGSSSQRKRREVSLRCGKSGMEDCMAPSHGKPTGNTRSRGVRVEGTHKVLTVLVGVMNSWLTILPFPIKRAASRKITYINVGVGIFAVVNYPVKGLIVEGGNSLEDLSMATGVTYRWGYYLVDGIYLEWVTLVKSISNPGDSDHKRMHEARRKDVKRAFGVLKKNELLVNPG
ncbi:ALP1-like protein [Tanacetum coccineum]